MKTLKLFPALILGVILLASTNTFAQPNKKVSPALAAFTNTEFMTKFHDLRIEAESAALGVIQNEDKFNAGDYKRLRTAYDQTTQRANNMLNAIKVDFLDKKKLKMIASYPEMYTEGLRAKLTDISDFYANNFQQTLADAQVIEEDGSAILLLVTELIGLTKGLMDYMADIKKEARRYNDAYLNQHLVGPYRWKSWGELDGTKTYREPSAANMQPRQRKSFDQIENRMGRVTERYDAVKTDRKTKAQNNSSSNDDWDSVDEGSDDSWDSWGDDTGTDDWGDDTGTDDWGDDTGTDDWGDWEDGGASPEKNKFQYEEWNEGDEPKDKKKEPKKSSGDDGK